MRKGGQKSSTNPKIVEPLEGVYIQEVACGYGHTLFIARDEERDLPLLNKLPVYDPDKVMLLPNFFILHGLDWWNLREGVFKVMA